MDLRDNFVPSSAPFPFTLLVERFVDEKKGKRGEEGVVAKVVAPLR